MKKRKKDLLTESETKALSSIWERMWAVMEVKGIATINQLRKIIKEKRGDAPERSFFEKLRYPPAGGEYYNLSSAYLVVICDALDVSADYLLLGI